MDGTQARLAGGVWIHEHRPESPARNSDDPDRPARRSVAGRDSSLRDVDRPAADIEGRRARSVVSAKLNHRTVKRARADVKGARNAHITGAKLQSNPRVRAGVFQRVDRAAIQVDGAGASTLARAFTDGKPAIIHQRAAIEGDNAGTVNAEFQPAEDVQRAVIHRNRSGRTDRL